MLHEHFRCVEPIIRFSMQFYTEPIIPLRVPTVTERLDPPLIDVYVPHGRKDRRQINIAESDAIVDEIESIVSDASFEGRTIGVVSLIGLKQSHYIQTQLLSRIGEKAYLDHDITCGNAATFQGKERDIMFVSMVEDSETQSARTMLLWEQRFNVAFSRARDRMYLVRSVDETELRPDDLKARAIQHFKSPMKMAASDAGDLIELCESGFVRDVFQRLHNLGFRVTPQVKVAGRSIDMVVEGEQGRRLAIETDGDQYHTPEQWMDDIARQRTLERMGWRFWRCWGSSFRLDPDACMTDLIETMESLGIQPLWGERPRGVYTEHRVVEEPTPASAEIPEERDFRMAAQAQRPPETSVEAEEVSSRPTISDLVTTPPPLAEAASEDLSQFETPAMEETEIVEVGDSVLISYNDEPERKYTIRISDTEHDPDRIPFLARPVPKSCCNSKTNAPRFSASFISW